MGTSDFTGSHTYKAMMIERFDWQFQVDIAETRARTTKNAADHCTCAYCRNYYEAVEMAYPEVKEFLESFGINMQGPSELMPFTPTLMLACYRVHGRIITWGREAISADGISIVPEANDDGTFFLWVGEVELPWLQEENPDEVISPANQPEFLLRMQEIWLQRHEESLFIS